MLSLQIKQNSYEDKQKTNFLKTNRKQTGINLNTSLNMASEPVFLIVAHDVTSQLCDDWDEPLALDKKPSGALYHEALFCRTEGG